MTKRNFGAAVVVAAMVFFLLACWHIASLRYAQEAFFERTASLVALAAERSPTLEPDIVAAIKEPDAAQSERGRQILARYGYTRSQNAPLYIVQISPGLLLAAALAIVAAAILLLALRRGVLRRQRRVASLTAYLGHMNAGDYRLRPAAGEDFLSPLEDELYKTIVLLREGREQAAAARQSLADNLADIAHQLKTPLSSITLGSICQGEIFRGVAELPLSQDTSCQGVK